MNAKDRAHELSLFNLGNVPVSQRVVDRDNSTRRGSVIKEESFVIHVRWEDPPEIEVIWKSDVKTRIVPEWLIVEEGLFG